MIQNFIPVIYVRLNAENQHHATATSSTSRTCFLRRTDNAPAREGPKLNTFDPRNHAFPGGFETPPANEFSRAMRRATIHGVDAFDPHNQFYQSFHMIHSKAAAR
ncbi:MULTISPECIES: hypothetical protein [Rhizobium]|uniref:Uncharacterized protein n=1 Tax=Rhizobium lentis TaxID=1138194 RepID=A0A9Q3MEP6_9HYPH|nr:MULTISPECIES: hypothetical protein [Rhizobium]MBX4893521.1 hypothetical protein [Rhizobium bangladeshense]MBX4899078.1 hypothetical protein [Rhizobium bangladeshense]MBX4922092.1 hypothetical protein [Rhizobium bangladeshense]MBX4935313.1 hypothetical protein [Rhizobium bangladeshense]MBX4957907.1 hypothetical protein [Rhizobium lentis]